MKTFELLPEHLSVATHGLASNALRPVLSTIAVFPDKVVATDSYRLLEVEKEKKEHNPVLLDIASLHTARKAIKKSTEFVWFSVEEKETLVTVRNGPESVACLALTMEGTFPDYGNIIPKGKPLATVSLNARYLRDLADYVEKNGQDIGYDNRGVFIELYGKDKPVMFYSKTKEGNRVRGLIMPLRPGDELSFMKPRPPKI